MSPNYAPTTLSGSPCLESTPSPMNLVKIIFSQWRHTGHLAVPLLGTIRFVKSSISLSVLVSYLAIDSINSDNLASSWLICTAFFLAFFAGIYNVCIVIWGSCQNYDKRFAENPPKIQSHVIKSRVCYPQNGLNRGQILDPHIFICISVNLSNFEGQHCSFSFNLYD